MRKSKTFNMNLFSKYRTPLMGIATILVMFCHSYLVCVENVIPNEFLKEMFVILRSYATVGVDMFLLLSAVGLYYSFSKNSNVKEFYKKRFLRILPEMFIVSIIINCLTPGKGVKNFFLKITTLSTFVNGDTTIWFFAIIIIIYLLFPLLYKLHKKFNNKGMIVLAAIIIFVNLLIYNFYPTFYSNCEIVLTRLPIFVIGIILADYTYKSKKISRNFVWLSFLALIAINAFYYIASKNVIPYGFIITRYTNELLGLSYLFVFAYILEGFSLIVSKRVLTAFGQYSLEIYLIYEYLLKHCRSFLPYYDKYNFCYFLCIFVITIMLSMGLKKVNNNIVNILRGVE